MKIETIVKAKANDLKMRPNSSNVSLVRPKRSQLYQRMPGRRQDFLVLFNPDHQYKYCRDADRCFFGTAPTLAEVDNIYGNNTATSWLVAQLINLSEYCGLKEKATVGQLEDCAKTIVSIFYFLKVTELMYFFLKFKSGTYGRFYSFFDPQFITTSLRDFCTERNERYAKHEEELNVLKAKRQQAKAISYPEYLKLKIQKGNGKNNSKTD